MSTSIHHRMPLTSDYISDNPERDVTSIAVEVGGVVHLGHYSTRNGMIRVTYRLLVQGDPIGWHGERPEGIG